MRPKTSPESIYECALEVFARYGFRRARMEDVSDGLELAVGTLYRYVRDKRDLYERTVEFGIRRWQAKVLTAVEAQDDVLEKFKVMCRRGYEYLAQDQHLRAIIINDPDIFPLSPRKVRFPEIDNASIGLISAIINQGVAQGVFRRVNVPTTAEFLYSIYVMFIIKTYVKTEGQAASVLFDDGLDLLLHGLLSR